MGKIALVINTKNKTNNDDEKETIVTIDIGGEEIITSIHAQPSNVDSRPLDTDYAVTAKTPGESNETVVGYIDPENQQKADKGEFRAYSRDSDGNEKADIHIKKDGKIIFSEGTEPAMLGNKFMAKDNAHTHSTAFGPSGPPLVQWTASDFSQDIKLK